MEQNNDPFDFGSSPAPQGPKPQAGEPSGAQVYDIPPSSYQEPGGPVYPPPAAPPVAPPPSSSRRIWIIVLIVLLVLCCCCIVSLLVLWNTGDQILITLCQEDPTLPFCADLLP